MDVRSALRAGLVTAADVASLLDATERFASPSSLDALIGDVRRAARELTGADGVTFVLRERDTVYYADEEAIGPLWKGRRFPIDACISGWAITHGETVVIEDIYADPRVPHDAYRPTFVKSLAMVPIGTGRPLAAIGAYWATAQRPSARALLLLENLASRCALALAKQAAEDDLSRAQSLGEMQFRELFDAMPQLGWSARADGFVDFYNRGWYEYTGATPEQVQGWDWKTVHDPKLLPRVLERWHYSLRTGTPFDMEQPLRGRDGKFRWFVTRANPIRDPQGNIIRWVGISTDIDARRGAGEETEERLQLLVESVKDYALFMLDPSGRVASWNPGAERIKQYRAEEIIGQHFSKFYPPEDLAWNKCDFELNVAAAEGRFEDEGWRLRKDGTRFWANVVISAVRNRNGELIGYAKITRDLTERKRSEEESAARLAAEQANRAKDEFLAMLGHELRNPLSPIVTALQLMRMRGDKKSLKEQEIIDRQVKHLTRLVDDLLDVSRVARGKIELTKKPLQLSDVIIRAVEMASPLLEVRRHQLTVSVANRGLMVLADETRLAQVFANLLTNAAKYTDPGGVITIAAERVDQEIVVRVCDNGIGIAPELLPHVFDLFVQGEQTSERSRGGLGLGLTLVRRLIELHGGSVRARSDGAGKGSELTVRLPALAMEPVSDADEDDGAAALVPVGGGRRVLVVDDNVDAAELLCELLRCVGHDVAVAHDGPQGVERALQIRPEVAIVDIGLPVMDGYEVAERIRSGLGAASPYLIALTGYGQEHDKRRAEEAGFDRHMTKPLDPEALLQALRAPPTTARSF